MKNSIDQLEIKNFKSIKHLETDCKRVNVFIGKPNVGKSNILEAIGLLGVENSTISHKIFDGTIRYEEISNLYYDDNIQNDLLIKTNQSIAALFPLRNGLFFLSIVLPQGNNSIRELTEIEESKKKPLVVLPAEYLPFKIEFSPSGTFDQSSIAPKQSSNPIRKYHFRQQDAFLNKTSHFLLPPHGPNLFAVVDSNQDLRKEIADIFAEYGLQFVAYKKEGKFEILKNIDGYATKFNYSSIADTFQRLIFYFAVIDSNKDAVLVLEEPEVHSFPPYTKDLADRIVASEDNQFFITTHSPYMLQNLVSDLGPEELNVFITYYEDYQTKVKKLTPTDLQRVSDFGIDLFYNLDQFIENE